MASDNTWYKIDDIEKLDSPALVVFPERVKANIQMAISMTGDTNRLRPHVKTNKSPEAVTLMIEAGISKFKCATIAEAEMLGICGAKDVLLAYQPLGPKIQRFINLVKEFPTTNFSCLTDSFTAAKEQSQAFAANGLEVSVYIDLNTGMNRSGIIPGEEAIQLYSFVSSAKGTRIAGLHAYDGHIRDVDINVRTGNCNEAFALVEKMKTRVEEMGLQSPGIIAGGSPTFPIHAKRKQVESSPGTFIYWDKGYSDNCPEQSFLPAAILITRIISLPSGGRICTDLGHKSVAAENDIAKRVFFLNAEGLKPVGQSEEHFLLEMEDHRSYNTGDVLYGLPYHICPTVALYERAYTIENGRLTGEWKNIARDRKISL